MLHRRTWVIQVWNNMSANKQWQMFSFWVHYAFKKTFQSNLVLKEKLFSGTGRRVLFIHVWHCSSLWDSGSQHESILWEWGKKNFSFSAFSLKVFPWTRIEFWGSNIFFEVLYHIMEASCWAVWRGRDWLHVRPDHL